MSGILVVLLTVRKDVQTVSSRGSKSRNKVSVGEPAEGSLPMARSEKSLVGILLFLENASRIPCLSGWSRERDLSL